MTSDNANECLGYIIEGAELTDNLLQSYRNFHLTIQSIFIATGAGLTIAIIAFDEIIQFALATLILILLAIISLYILFKMHGIIIARGKDVNFWHRELIKSEQNLLPKNRYFTKFKIHQKLHRLDKADIKSIQKIFLSDEKIDDENIDENIDSIIEKGLGHTRKILDRWLFVGIGILWVILVAISVFFSIYRYLNVQQ